MSQKTQQDGIMCSHLLATVEQPLLSWLHFEELRDFQTQLIHLGEF